MDGDCTAFPGSTQIGTPCPPEWGQGDLSSPTSSLSCTCFQLASVAFLQTPLKSLACLLNKLLLGLGKLLLGGLKPSLPQAQQAQLPQPLPVQQVLQPLPILELSAELMAVCQYFCYWGELGKGKLSTALWRWSSKDEWRQMITSHNLLCVPAAKAHCWVMSSSVCYDPPSPF